MAKNFFYLSLILTVVLFGCKKTDKESVQIEVIDGIPHVMNPELPIKGTILLEVEKGLEIDPHKYYPPDVDREPVQSWPDEGFKIDPRDMLRSRGIDPDAS